MSEHHPMKIRLDADKWEKQEGWCFDDEAYTHADNDTLYIRADMIFEHLLEKGYNITVTLKCDKEDLVDDA